MLLSVIISLATGFIALFAFRQLKVPPHAIWIPILISFITYSMKHPAIDFLRWKNIISVSVILLVLYGGNYLIENLGIGKRKS